MSAFVSLLLLLLARSPGQGEPVLRLDLLDNGSFAEVNAAAVDSRGARPIPWWRSVQGMEQLVASPDRTFAVRTKGVEWAEQPVAAFGPLSHSCVFQGRVRGKGKVVLTASGRIACSRSFDGKEGQPFEIQEPWMDVDRGKDVELDVKPRFVLRLEAASPSDEASWSNLSALVSLPCPTEGDLRAEILALLKEIIAPWLERGVDDLGPKKTGLLCHLFDAVTGERLSTTSAGMHPLWEQMSLAMRVEDVPEWRAAIERFLDDWLTLCLDPGTGLPRAWDCGKDEPIADRPAGDLALPLGFLIDIAESGVAENGPGRFRDRARAAAEKIAQTVLARGVLPDGTIGASYFPEDGRANTSVPELRRFDLLAQLARLPKVRTDPRFVRASEELRSSFEFAHSWSGEWDKIDPGFDDEFGNYGARAAAIALADPEGKEGQAFQRLATEGFRYYAPRWRDALRLGGNVAADQVRCWSLLGELGRVDPSTKSEIASLLRLAARSHFKGEQYGDGSWGDVTIYRFDPKTALQVGDYPGAPQNLLNGLATIYAADLGLRTDEVRAMYTAVLRSSVKAYRRPFGFLVDRSERKGGNPAVGSIRMLLGLVKMLRALPIPR